MMQPASRGRLVRLGGSRLGGSRRRKSFEWEPIAVFSTGISPNNVAQAQIIAPVEVDEMGEATVLRIRGELVVEMVSGVPADVQAFWWGISVQPAETATTGASVATGSRTFPSPFSDGNWHGWLAHGSIPFFGRNVVETADVVASRRFMIDSKGMRRIHEGEQLVWGIEAVTAAGTPRSMQYMVTLRMLLKLASR